MSCHQLPSSRLGGCPGLHVRSPGAGASLLGMKQSLRKSVARRGVVTCAKPTSKSKPKTEDQRWGLKLWGTKKKTAVANGKSPPARGTQQIRRPKNAAKARPGPGAKAKGEMVKAKQNAAKCLKDIAVAEKQLEQLKKSSVSLGERAAALQARARECQSVEKGVAAGAVAAERAVEKVQKDVELLRSKADDLAKQEAAARAVLSAMESAAMAGIVLTKQEQDAVALQILQPELARKRAEAEQRRAELANRKVAFALAKAPRKVAPKATRGKVQMPVAAKAYAPPSVTIEDLEAKAAEAQARGDNNEEAKLRAQAADEARREATEKAIAEAAAKLEADQRARESAAEEARKAILAEAKVKAQAAAVAKREGAANKKTADAAKQKAKAEAEREAQRAAKEKEKQKAQAKAEEAVKKAEATKKQAEAKAAEPAQQTVTAASSKLEKAAKKKPAAAAKAKPPAAVKAKPAASAGFKWPWQSASAPEPEEMVERRGEAQEWIENWKNGAPAGDAQKARQVVETNANIVEAKPKAASKTTGTAAAKAKRPASTGFKWPWAPAPEPEELVQRRKEAQEWIDNWKAGSANNGKK